MWENPIITELTPEQEALIPDYRDKRRKIALSTERIDEQKATEAIKAGYNFFDSEVPDIEFFDSPKAALKELSDIYYDYKDFSILCDLRHPLINYPYERSHNTCTMEERTVIEQDILKIVLEQHYNIHTRLELELDLDEEFLIPDEHMLGGIQTDFSIAECCFYDFCISVLKLPHNQQKWKAFRNIVQNCGWVFDYNNICLISNRPTSLSFDEQNNLHESNGKTAIEYADGFKVYAHHGTWIPEKYGQVPSSQWKSQWLLSEENAELKRILIQVIGYNKICEELGAIELDSWNEYTLLKIENYTEINNSHNSQNNSEPMHLLKMTCPSTEHIHFLRVPPDITSARVGITWINWGVDPEEFEIQT